jgi:hypothetical protein
MKAIVTHITSNFDSLSLIDDNGNKLNFDDSMVKEFAERMRKNGYRPQIFKVNGHTREIRFNVKK